MVEPGSDKGRAASSADGREEGGGAWAAGGGGRLVQAALSGSAGATSSGAAQQVGQDIREVLTIVTDLARLVVTSPEFRRLFQDLSVFLLEVLSVKVQQTREAIEHQVTSDRPLTESLQDVAKEVANKVGRGIAPGAGAGGRQAARGSLGINKAY